MPSLTPDPSYQATTFRARVGAPVALDGFMQFASEITKNMMQRKKKIPVNVVGVHNGLALGAEQTDAVMQNQQLNPYPTSKSPFLDQTHASLYPITHEVNPLGSTAGEFRNQPSLMGTPLAFALDDSNQLEQRIYTERMRNAPQNVLSAEFALQAQYQRSRDIEPGSMTDVMRRDLYKQEYDHRELDRMNAAGYLVRQKRAVRNQVDILTQENYLKRKRAQGGQDLTHYQDLFGQKATNAQGNLPNALNAKTLMTQVPTGFTPTQTATPSVVGPAVPLSLPKAAMPDPSTMTPQTPNQPTTGSILVHSRPQKTPQSSTKKTPSSKDIEAVLEKMYREEMTLYNQGSEAYPGSLTEFKDHMRPVVQKLNTGLSKPSSEEFETGRRLVYAKDDSDLGNINPVRAKPTRQGVFQGSYKEGRKSKKA